MVLEAHGVCKTCVWAVLFTGGKGATSNLSLALSISDFQSSVLFIKKNDKFIKMKYGHWKIITPASHSKLRSLTFSSKEIPKLHQVSGLRALTWKADCLKHRSEGQVPGPDCSEHIMWNCNLFPEKMCCSVYWKQGIHVLTCTTGPLTHTFDQHRRTTYYFPDTGEALGLQTKIKNHLFSLPGYNLQGKNRSRNALGPLPESWWKGSEWE